MLTESIHDKYRQCPASVEKITLAQFAMRYDLVSGPESSKMRKSEDKLDVPPEVADGDGWEGNLNIVIGLGGEILCSFQLWLNKQLT